MRLLIFLAAIAVLFALSDTASAQTAFAAAVSAGPMSDQSAPSAREAGLRTLSWPGKVVQTPRPRPQVSAVSSFSGRRIWNPEPLAPPASAPARVATPPAPAPRQAAALPTSIYAAAPPAPAPAPVVQQARAAPRAMSQATSSADGDYQPPHFYSLYREYGQNPDPIPLSSQFFAASTPDLAQPPPPVPHTVTTSSGRVIQSVSPSPDDVPG